MKTKESDNELAIIFYEDVKRHVATGSVARIAQNRIR